MLKQTKAEICGCAGVVLSIFSLFGIANQFAPYRVVPFWLMIVFIALTALSVGLELWFSRPQTIAEIKRGRIFF